MAGRTCKFYPECKFTHPNFGKQPESGKSVAPSLVGSDAPSMGQPVVPKAQASGMSPAPNPPQTEVPKTCTSTHESCCHGGKQHTNDTQGSKGQFKAPHTVIQYLQPQPQQMPPQAIQYPAPVVQRLPVVNPSAHYAYRFAGPGAWQYPLYSH